MKSLKILLKAFAGLLTAVVILACAVLILALTPWGLQLAVHSAQKALPQLTIENAAGTLADATLEGLHFEDRQTDVAVQTASWTLANIAIFDRFVSVDSIALEGLKVRAKTPAETSTETPDESHVEASNPQAPVVSETKEAPFALPVGFALRALTVSDADVCYDDTCVKLTSFETGLRARGNRITLDHTAVTDLAVTLPPAPQEPPKPLAQTIASIFKAPLLADLPDIELPVAVNLQRFSLQNLVVNDQKLVHTLGLNLKVEGHSVVVDNLSVDTPFGRIEPSTFELQTSDVWPVEGAVTVGNIPAADFGTVSGKISLNGALLNGIKLTADIDSPSEFHLTANIDPSKAQLPLDLTATGSLAIPETYTKDLFAGAAAVDLQTFKFTGNWNDWTAALQTHVTMPEGKPEAELQLDITGQKLAADYSLNTTLGKELSVKSRGNLLLADRGLTLAADTGLQVADIQTLLQTFETPVSHPLAKGSVDVASTVHLKTDETFQRFTADIATLKATGKLNGQPLAVDAALVIDEALHADIGHLTATLARNRVDLKGKAQADRADVALELNASDLHILEPKLAGSLSGNAQIQGPWEALNVKTQLTGERIQYESNRIGKLALAADIKALGKTASSVRARAFDIEANGQTMDSARVTLSGTQKEHTLEVSADGKPLHAALAWKGSLNDALNLWTAQLTKGDVRAARMHWALAGLAPMTVDVKGSAVAIGKHCWKETKTSARLCVDEPLRLAQSGQGTISLKDLPVSLLQHFAPQGVKLIGSVNGQVNAQWQEPSVEVLNVTAALDAAGAGLTAVVADKPVKVVLQTARLDAVFNHNRAQADMTVAVDPANPLTAAVTVEDPTGQSRLNAKVTSNRLALHEFSGIVSALSPITQIKGSLTTNLELTGTPEAPVVKGNLSVDALQLSGPTVPLDMQPSNFDIHFKGTNSELSGKLLSSEGPLIFDGHADWRDLNAPTAQVRVHGNNFRVISAPYVKALVTPDVSVTVDNDRIALSGKISIPQAHLSAESIPESAVTVSSDEVIVDENMQPIVKAPTKPVAIDSTLAIELGDDVNVKAFGLAAQLTGTVTVTQTNDALGLRGTLTIPEGRFQAYGQDLIIRKGSFIFSGPMADPTVELVAERNPDSIEDDVTVGIRVLGPVSQMKSEIFSDPTMDQASQLSYLLRGRGLETNAEDNSMLSSALLTIGLSQTGQLISGIGDALMIRDLGVSTQGVGANSQVVVSGYVLPDLQVKYAMNIFDSLSTLTLRYRLMPKLFVEASSGVYQAVDVLYNFEF